MDFGRWRISEDSAVGELQKEVTEKGHPLMWSEWKPVTLLYSTLFLYFPGGICFPPDTRFWSSVLGRAV